MAIHSTQNSFLILAAMIVLALAVSCAPAAAVLSSTMTPTPAPSPTPGPQPSSTPEWTRSGWTLVWQDEFNGTEIDKSKWTFDKGGDGWGNAELEYYTDRPENAHLENGSLVITARKEAYKGSPYTSARLKTQDLAAWTYGRVEARIRIPRGQGLWPAFWMMGNNIYQVGWPGNGEIDIMENIGKEPARIHGTAHGPGYSGPVGPSSPFDLASGAFADEFHVFAIEWQPAEIRWYVDDQLYKTLIPTGAHGKWVFDHPFFILLNVAVGGGWPGYPDETSIFPQSMQVDYVRVYQKAQ